MHWLKAATSDPQAPAPPAAAAAADADETEQTSDQLCPERQSKKQQRGPPAPSPAANRPVGVGGVQVLYRSSKKGKAAGCGRRLDFLAKHLKTGGVLMRGGVAEGDEDRAAANVQAVETWQSLQVGGASFAGVGFV